MMLNKARRPRYSSVVLKSAVTASTRRCSSTEEDTTTKTRNDATATAVRRLFVGASSLTCVGALVFRLVLEPEWSLLDSLYFSVVTFSTVGYGDLRPSTDASRLFCVTYALVGIVAFGVLLGVLGQMALERQEEAVQTVTRYASSKLLKVFEPNSEIVDDDESSAMDEAPPPFPPPETSTLVSLARSKFATYFSVFVLILALAALFRVAEGWLLAECLYYAMVTATTVGYGDVVPADPYGRLLALVFVPVSVGLVGALLGGVADVLVDRGIRQREERILSRTELNATSFDEMNEDGDDEVSEDEFLAYMLRRMERVDRETVDRVSALFDRLDVDGNGVLNRDDLDRRARHARRRLSSVALGVGVVDSSFRTLLRATLDRSERSSWSDTDSSKQ